MKKHFFLAMACMMSAFATAQTYQNPVIDRSYHAVSVKDPKGRKLLMDQVHWVDGWPVVLGNQPSSAYQVPKIK